MRKRHPSRLHLLSVREVQSAGSPNAKLQPGDHGDGGGLILRVRDDGSAQWVFRFTAPSGKRREMGLGVAERGNVKQAGQSLTAARDAAAKARALLQQGTDPIDERARLRDAARARADEERTQQRRQQITLAKAARDYHERVIETRLSGKHAAQWISSLENHVPPAIWHKPIGDIAAPELLQALAGVRSLEEKDERVPETLRRIRQRLETVFEDAMFHNLCTSNPAAAVKRKLREQLPAKKPGAFKALDYREVPALMARLRACEGVSARALEFALLTASRTSEVLGACWEEFNMEEGVWTIPGDRMKGDEPHTVYLSKPARELVAGQIGLDQRFLFPSTMNRGKPLSNMALLATLGRLGARGRTTAHGLCRSSFSTWANELAIARPDVVEACLAHKEADKVRAAYNRAQFNAERAGLMATWAQYLNNQHEANAVALRAV